MSRLTDLKINKFIQLQYKLTICFFIILSTLSKEVIKLDLVFYPQSPHHGLGPGGVQLDRAAAVVKQGRVLGLNHLLRYGDHHESRDLLSFSRQFFHRLLKS